LILYGKLSKLATRNKRPVALGAAHILHVLEARYVRTT
jgi:hypothetical protein